MFEESGAVCTMLEGSCTVNAHFWKLQLIKTRMVYLAGLG